MSAAVAALVVVAVGADFGTAVYAEYQLSRAVRQANDLTVDPFVAILDFPYLTQLRRDHYDEVEIKAPAVERPLIGKAMLEATMHSVDLSEATWRFRPDAPIPVAKLESRIIIGSVHLGRYLGIRDLMIEAPPAESDDSTGGTTESGISSEQGLVFTGTPAGFGKRVSVSVDLSIGGPDRTTLIITPTGILTGPDTADQKVPDEQRALVLNAFRGSLPQQRLPFGLTPTAQGARGSDVIIEGIAEDMTVTLPGFRR
ncbi:mannan chain length control protein LmeA [[Mycobacterium] kokjensenii]|uniref:Mannan chain length control protein LmeA n=2 Tax=[Mycobacterium] kokjensenii TaxID=3064287 RepID=A0ABN9NBV1_9MYCO|nr:mannan chain length control protein LmeA [Mycolicibacter sp. MU0083]CAJ1503827.1 mannan chain length control protein LmeA [Mycolicibacter sp. MU0083]